MDFWMLCIDSEYIFSPAQETEGDRQTDRQIDRQIVCLIHAFWRIVVRQPEDTNISGLGNTLISESIHVFV